MAEKPGVMVYFDTVRPAFERMDNAELGALFRAIVNYAEYGEISDLDGMAGLTFDLLRPKIDRDGQRYRDKCEQSRYATYCREMKKLNAQPLPYDKWKNGSGDIGRYLTTTASPIVTLNTSPAATAAAEGSPGGDTLLADWNTKRNRALDLAEGYTNG